MQVINAINVNDAFAQGCAMMLDNQGDIGDSRNGPVVEFGPVTTVYERPWERVLWDTARDCNPFFHLFESFWMLGGRNDVKYVAEYNKKIGTYSDNGVHFHGAYGYRWRHFFQFDQLDEAVRQLKEDPTSRRVMVSMWSAAHDMIPPVEGPKDLPCNLMAKFEIRSGMLNMIVFNRSNDMIWGAFGANAVHFSMLQEYIAARLGLPMGKYWQVSGNFHVYTKVWDDLMTKCNDATKLGSEDLYLNGDARVSGICQDARALDGDIQTLLRGGDTYTNTFFQEIAHPLDEVWGMWKNRDRARALVELLKLDQTNDWVLACRLWMQRRITK